MHGSSWTCCSWEGNNIETRIEPRSVSCVRISGYISKGKEKPKYLTFKKIIIKGNLSSCPYPLIYPKETTGGTK
jgi:hypothetical protein